MSRAYLSHFYKNNLYRDLNLTPRKVFVKYYQDLYRSEKLGALSMQSFTSGGQYNFSEVARPLFNYYSLLGLLGSIDLMVFSITSDEFDPIHSYGHALMEEYDVQCRVLDVTDQGALSVFTAVTVACAYLMHGEAKRTLLLSLEQSTLPRNSNAPLTPPMSSGGFAFLIDNTKVSEKNSVLYSQIVTEDVVLLCIYQLVDEYSDETKHITLVMNVVEPFISEIVVNMLSAASIEFIQVNTVGEIFERIICLNNDNSTLLIAVAKCRSSSNYGLLAVGNKE